MLETFLQCLTLDEVHYEVPAAHIAKLLIDAREVGMGQPGQETCLAPESISGFQNFLRTTSPLAHFFDCHQSVVELDILCFVHSTKAAFAYLANDAIASIEHMCVREQASRGGSSSRSSCNGITSRNHRTLDEILQRRSTGRAIESLWMICCSTGITKV